ncbi:hypothetical protein F4604DRAFT_1927594 [Suillus subluteus]|nr:hypothetical protein F4604DRAFT_1927594 [Suillus subluteus]
MTGSGNSTNTSSSNSTSTSNSTAPSDPCTAISNAQSSTVINPVMSGHLNTHGKRLKYGRVKVCAKLPQGDWYGPLSGCFLNDTLLGLATPQRQ